jgi:hypothetical protein
MDVIANHGRFSRGAAISSLAGKLFLYEMIHLLCYYLNVEKEVSILSLTQGSLRLSGHNDNAD